MALYKRTWQHCLNHVFGGTICSLDLKTGNVNGSLIFAVPFVHTSEIERHTLSLTLHTAINPAHTGMPPISADVSSIQRAR